ncbi:TPA: hypothetical protein ACIYJR_004856 [Escherichia coli]|uniref:Uncharacterized protein n=1 Tax=Escherichia coli TaxID=562 RepID=A0A895NU85_ECOLX|nr:MULTISPECIES: hypothetical protein [Enterobacteriaceae]EEK9350696.1 hypothetical protein [Salmonella enterica]EII9885699.1 hypothetical protein [Salmonella enterica subsp. enterica serovar Infantis]EEW1706225.1 hypothetical protein [Escherichia coli]EFB3594764.1 hypothetical protein [Escherichia coli]EFM3298317.1 hypothetical protein [Escherichia coli]
MNNETEKAMWSCKTSDTPWTFSSLLKKLLAVELSNSIKLTNSSEKNDELPAFLDSRPYWEYQQWEEQK